MKKLIYLLALLCLSLSLEAQDYAPRFHRLSYIDGLSHNTVNCIYKASDGFVWVGTQLGLNRYDGIRVRRFFSIPGKDFTLPDNSIYSIHEDALGKLWLRCSSKICIFDPVTENVNRDVKGWLKDKGIKGNVARVTTDGDRNLWVATSDNGVWYYNFKNDASAQLVSQSQMPQGNITDITVKGTVGVICYDNGLIAGVGRKNRDLMWISNYITKNRADSQPREYRTFIDSRFNLWVASGTASYLYVNSSQKWSTLPYGSVYSFAEDSRGNILLGTDHNGMICLDRNYHENMHLTNILFDETSLPDNTINSIFVDDAGIVWVGTYRMGLAFFYSGRFMANTLALGDVTCISRDRNNILWAGTNDNGLMLYNFSSGVATNIHKDKTGLGSDIIVSLLAARDGSMYVGTFQGGMARYRDGKWTVWRQKAGGLSDDNVWSLAELPDGRIAIGTLLGGLQLFNPRTGTFRTYNIKNSKIATNYVASISYDRKHNLLYMGTSLAFSVLDLKTNKIANFVPKGTDEGEYFSSNNFNQIFVDSRGLIWAATAAGLDVYDPVTKYIHVIALPGNRLHDDIAAVTEGKDGKMWVTTSDGVDAVTVGHNNGGWDFLVNNYGKSDGINNRLFNKRSLSCAPDGCILMGGIDGLNYIDPRKMISHDNNVRVIFSDIAVFGKLVHVGEKFDGSVILDEALDVCREISLSHTENTLTINLATNQVGQLDRPRFLYRVEEISDKWLMTSQSEPSVTLTDMSFGNYTLQVRAVDHAGNPMKGIATLKIRIRPPFYLSVWALLIYTVLLIIGSVFFFKYVERRREAKKSVEDLKQEKELDNIKQNFFVSMSEELNTPLATILSPLPSIINAETNATIVRQLRHIWRNARMMLFIVNQMIDLRKLLNNKEELTLNNENIVSLARQVCDDFFDQTEKRMHLTFHSVAKTIMMDYDVDKVQKMVLCLLIYAFKYTPEDGHIDVDINIRDDEKMLDISVSDDGKMVSDNDLSHIFERFYQPSDMGFDVSASIGLNLLWEYANMHGGTVVVNRNAGAGKTFVVSLPMKNEWVKGNPVNATCSLKEERARKAADGVADAIQDNDDLDTNIIDDSKTQQEIEREHADQTLQQEKYDKDKKTILVVDESPDFLELMSFEFGRKYNVLLAHNGSEALYVISKRHVDLVITDAMMSPINGLELCQKLKSQEDTKNIPVMLLTALITEKNEKEILALGFDDYVRRPFNTHSLDKHVRKLLGLSPREED